MKTGHGDVEFINYWFNSYVRYAEHLLNEDLGRNGQSYRYRIEYSERDEMIIGLAVVYLQSGKSTSVRDRIRREHPDIAFEVAKTADKIAMLMTERY